MKRSSRRKAEHGRREFGKHHDLWSVRGRGRADPSMDRCAALRRGIGARAPWASTRWGRAIVSASPSCPDFLPSEIEAIRWALMPEESGAAKSRQGMRADLLDTASAHSPGPSVSDALPAQETLFGRFRNLTWVKARRLSYPAGELLKCVSRRHAADTLLCRLCLTGARSLPFGLEPLATSFRCRISIRRPTHYVSLRTTHRPIRAAALARLNLR
jgi:hypothetical protein